MMKAHAVILLVIIPLLMGSVAKVHSGSVTAYVVTGSACGGDYCLASMTWPVQGIISGEGYYLIGPQTLTGTGTPCCCSYLPCVLRNH